MKTLFTLAIRLCLTLGLFWGTFAAVVLAGQLF